MFTFCKLNPLANHHPFIPSTTGSPKLYIKTFTESMSNKCTVIIIQAGDVESNHIRLTNIPYEPNSTSYQFKSSIHKLLKTPEYKTSLINEISYYSHIGIINESISPHDIFEIDDNDILMDCISPNDTLYIYNPSINGDTVLIQEYIQFFNQQNNYLYENIETKCDEITSEIPEQSQSYRTMSISQSEDIDILCIPNDNDNAKKQMFFNSINLYFAYAGAKYGNDGAAKHSSQLVQISHSILIWALRKMDNLWKRKDVQDKLTEYLKTYCFKEEVIIDTIIFGNKLTDQNAMNLITYTPWMVCEPSFSIATYAKLKQERNSLSSEQAYAPIVNEQITILNSNNSTESESQSVDHPYFHQNEHKSCNNNDPIDPDSPIPHQEKYKDDSLDNTFNEIKQNKDMIENGPKRWPAREGMFLYFCQFVCGLCNYEKFEKYMYNFGENIGLNKNTIKYIILIWESEKDLAKSLWNFAELEFPLIH